MFAYLVLRAEASGPVVVSRHRDDAGARKALRKLSEGAPEAESGLFVRAIALGRLASPVFQPKIGDKVRVDRVFAYPAEG